MSVIGRLPALVMNMTGYDCCLMVKRMQTSGVKEERIMVRSPAKRQILLSVVSINVFSSIAIGATQASTASCSLGYSSR